MCFCFIHKAKSSSEDNLEFPCSCLWRWRKKSRAMGLEKPQRKTQSQKRAKREEKPIISLTWSRGIDRPQRAVKHKQIHLSQPSTHRSFCRTPSWFLSIQTYPPRPDILSTSSSQSFSIESPLMRFVFHLILFYPSISTSLRVGCCKPCGIDITNLVCEKLIDL